jgi:serpin B
MYLINAIYFKSSWKEKFNPLETSPKTFNTAAGNAVQTSFMSATVHCNTYADGQAIIAELPYSNSKYSMVMVMPASGTPAQSLLSSIDSAKWQTWMGKLQPNYAYIAMPKFTFSYNTDFSSTLANLGMGVAFSDQADFTRISTQGGLKITHVLHKAYIDVNEDGSEAAAATGVVVGTTAVPPIFTFNQSFIFVIREMKTGLILFTGMVNNPAQQ